MSYDFAALLVRVHDGDTVFLDLDLGFHVWLHATRSARVVEDQASRLARINAPELRMRDLVTGKLIDNPAGLASRDALSAFLAGKTLAVQSIKSEKFGRYLIELIADGVNVNDWMVTNGFAIYQSY